MGFMVLSIIYEGRFFKDDAGKVYTRFKSDSYEFWAEVLDIFDNVKIFARVIPYGDLNLQNLYRVDGDNVKIIELRDYNRKYSFLSAAIYNNIKMIPLLFADDKILLWGVGPLAMIMSALLLSTGRRFGLRIVGDPDAVFSDPAVRIGCRRVLRVIFSKAQRKLAKQATTLSYVSKFILPKKYPAGDTTSEVIFPDTSILSKDILANPRNYSANDPAKKLITIASLEQLYKGVDLLIKALAICKEKSELFSLTVVGDGRYKAISRITITYAWHF
jgi:glycosyltransferase involved in cell wall biosynthesis